MIARASIAMVLVSLSLAVACQPARPAPDRPIVILISIDGFRWDYLDTFAPANLLRLSAEGVRADRLIPEFPSKTFPNHYTIVTGLTSAHHGIISNNIKAPDIPGEFSLSNREVQSDPRWWGGEPIWNTAERQGLKSAPMFWPGSEVLIGGRRSTYWMPYQDDMPHEQRVKQVLDWLQLPPGERPSFLTLYFSDVDSAGHRHGPDADETRAAVAKVDRSLGQLIAGVERSGMTDRVHYVIVSDHGMSALSPDRTVVLDDYLDLATVDVVDWSPVLGVNPRGGNLDAIYAKLKDKHPALSVFRRHEIPEAYALANHPRVPAIFGVVSDGWQIASRRDVARWQARERTPPGGAHGYDASNKSMHGVFVAAGPRIRSALRVAPIRNIHLYELMCAILGIQPAKNDGDPAATRDMLR